MAAVLKPIPIIPLHEDSNKDHVWKGWFEHVRFIVNNNVLSTSWSNISSTPTSFSGYGISTTSANLLAAISDETGTGSLVFANTPTLVTPVLGAATGTSVVLTGDVTTGSAAQFHKTSVALTDGAGVGAGTLLTAPAAGNPTKWIGIDDNGTIRYIPAW